MVDYILPAALGQLLFYFLLRFFFPSGKARAWLLTLPVSFFFGYIVGPYFCYELLQRMLFGPPSAVADFLVTQNELGRFAASYMLGFLALDLLVGIVDYREHIELLSGWMHHPVYFVVYSYFLSRGLQNMILIGAICEVPTFLMALARLFPSTRTDLGFGVTFFLTRIAWFGLLIVVYITPTYNPGIVDPIVLASLTVAATCLHIFWFINTPLVKGCVRKPGGGEGSAPAASSTSTGKQQSYSQ
jgi:hypothetical protein